MMVKPRGETVLFLEAEIDDDFRNLGGRVTILVVLHVKDLRTDPVHLQLHKSQMGYSGRKPRTYMYFALELKSHTCQSQAPRA